MRDKMKSKYIEPSHTLTSTPFDQQYSSVWMKKREVEQTIEQENWLVLN